MKRQGIDQEKNRIPALTLDDCRELSAVLSKGLMEISDPAVLKKHFVSWGLRITVWKDKVKIETAPDEGSCFYLRSARGGLEQPATMPFNKGH
ncbi:MAG: hypothetical protein HQM09_21795 [Candidatus Riflebacteria bacterium]|nr:hypothetical protein [Candidatus Riflebacteria bacterium]